MHLLADDLVGKRLENDKQIQSLENKLGIWYLHFLDSQTESAFSSITLNK